MEKLVMKIGKLGDSRPSFSHHRMTGSLDDSLWHSLEKQMRTPEITPRSSEELKACWEDGRAAIALHESTIVGYISIVPLYNDARRKLLAANRGNDTTLWPSVEVYEVVAVWTAKSWRKNGIGLNLMRELLASMGKMSVILSACYGMAASPLHARLGWTLVSWDEAVFARHLLGWIEDERYFWVRSQAVDPLDWKPYKGGHLNIDAFPKHDWDQYCHVWVQDRAAMLELDGQLKELANGDLKAWRQALKTMAFQS